MKEKFLKKKELLLTTIFMVINFIFTTFATSPDKSKVESVAVDGIELFFGALGGIAVVMGGIEFWGAFLAYRDNDEEGGSGEANAKIGKKVLAGVLCLVGAVIVFVVMNWTKTLFNLD